MRMQGLSLETIPPIHIPFRFFHTAPWLGAAAGVAIFAAFLTGNLSGLNEFFRLFLSLLLYC